MATLPKGLPKKLNKEPLIEAVFEIRFKADLPIAHILPGYLLETLKSSQINTFPMNEIPKAIRENDPNLKYSPLVKLELENFFLYLGDYTIDLACKIPYTGWATFKEFILQVIKDISRLPFLKDAAVERYSMKYVDLIQSTDLSEQVNYLDMNLNISKFKLTKENFQIKVERQDEGFIHLISFISSAVALINQKETQGLVVEVDTVRNVLEKKFSDVFSNFEPELEKIHLRNKEEFFNCLRDETIEFLEPIY